jgi:hypothetical protein
MAKDNIGRRLTNDQVAQMVRNRISNKNRTIQELQTRTSDMELEIRQLRQQLTAANESSRLHASLLGEVELILKAEEEDRQGN